MDRSVAMLLIGLVFGGGIGFVVAASQGVALEPHDHANPAHHSGSAAQGEHGLAHEHGDPIDLAAGADAPTLAVTLTPDAKAGWNLHMQKTNFRFSPENASGGHVPGEGHAHVYVNGVKVMRAYGDWVHLDALPKGETTVAAALYSNDHRPLTIDGAPISQEVTITVD